MKFVVATLIAFVLVCGSTLQAQEMGAQPMLVASPTSLTIPAGSAGAITLTNKAAKPQEWQLSQPLPLSVVVSPLTGSLGSTLSQKVTIKAAGKAGERVTLLFVSNTGEKVPVAVTIGNALTWSLVPATGTTEGKPVPVQIKNDLDKPLIWKAGILPKGVTVTPMTGTIPAHTQFTVQIQAVPDPMGAAGATATFSIPFIGNAETKAFKLTLNPSSITTPGGM